MRCSCLSILWIATVFAAEEAEEARANPPSVIVFQLGDDYGMYFHAMTLSEERNWLLCPLF